MRMSLSEADAFIRDCLIKAGCDELNAAAVAATVGGAERDICASHGLFRLPGYLKSLNSGKVNGKSRPRVEQLAPSVLRVHGDDGFAPMALSVGRDPLVRLAQQQGIAALGIIKTHHFAALWPEVSALAERGLCAFAFTSYKPVVAPAGGKRAMYGTNPMAFGWPRPNGQPMVFDQASATLARGDIMIAARDGHTVPLGVGLDADGNETTDPNAILKGVQLAFGGYKGAALALMVELLAGPLIGEALSFETAITDNNDGGPPSGGEFLMAIDPSRFGDPQNFAAHAELLFARMLEEPGVRLPADRRYANRKITAERGIEFPDSIYAEILSLVPGHKG